MKKSNFIIIAFSSLFACFALWSCATPQAIVAKTGVQLWSENCIRCHNAPPPNAFNKDNWDVIATHMKVKAGLTVVEEEKIAEFLKSGN